MSLDNKASDYAKAWCSLDPDQVAAHYAPDGSIRINNGDVLEGREAIRDMAAGFYTEFPDLVVLCDLCRSAGSHAIFVWTLKGHHAETGNAVEAQGWEEWELTPEGLVQTSLGWFDAEDYQRQIDGM